VVGGRGMGQGIGSRDRAISKSQKNPGRGAKIETPPIEKKTIFFRPAVA